jgi:beta-galactosidase
MRLLSRPFLTTFSIAVLAVGPDQQLPAAVHVQHGVNRLGKRLHYYFNYGSGEVRLTYPYAAGTNLLDGRPIAKAAELTLAPWDLAIVEEK